MARKLPNADTGRPIEHNEDFQGPLKKRSCTDVVCLFLFLVFIIGWIAVGIWALRTGDPSTLLAPRDSSGLRCGLDDEVKDLHYLFFFDITKCLSSLTLFTGCQTPQVCVEKCPEDIFIADSELSHISDNEALPFCKYDYRNGSYDAENCPTWFLPSQDTQLYFNRCIPSVSLNQDTLNEIAKLLNVENINSTLNSSISNIKLLSQLEQMGKDVLDDIQSSWLSIFVGVIVAIFICLIYIVLLRWIASIMVWISIAGGVAALVAACAFSGLEWKYLKNEYETSGQGKTKLDLCLGLFIVCSVFLVIVLFIILVLRKRIQLAIALIKEGSKAVSSVTSVLFFPIFPWILQIGVCVYAVCVGVYLASIGEPRYQYRNLSVDCRTQSGWTINTNCNKTLLEEAKANFSNCGNTTCQLTGISNEAAYPYLQGLNIFCFFWLYCFVPALGQMVIAQVFAQWYWTMKKRNLPFFALTAAFYRTVRYHVGTLAFGSLLIAICKIIRLCLEYISKKLKKYDNSIVRAILCCMKCFFWCLEKFLKFLNKNAYIMCAIHGKNFCTSAKDAFSLLLRNILRVFVLDKVTDFIFFLSKLLVAGGVGCIAYIVFCTHYVVTTSSLKYNYVPVIVIIVAAYLVATLFFSVYSMAVDTLFLCFLEDYERNDGKSRPYYMSRSLMQIFGKKNR